ncbi:hypothetical protein J6590_067187 [Homalodisca vitripennis]|nr:hypothetical protein J6590_067187 [Homalodisca vitripennis]
MSSCPTLALEVILGYTSLGLETPTSGWRSWSRSLSPFEGIQLEMGPAKSLVKVFKVSTFIPKDIGVNSKRELFEALKNQNGLETG